MTVDWLRALAPPVEALEHALHESAFIESTHTGPRTFDRMDYPVGEVLPQSVTRTQPNQYTHSIRANCYFQRARDTDYIDDILHAVADVTEEGCIALRATDCVSNYVPSNFDAYAGELDNTLVVLISIEFDITTLVDVADAGATA